MSPPSTIQVGGVGYDPKGDWKRMNGWLVGRQVVDEEIKIGKVEGEVQCCRGRERERERREREREREAHLLMVRFQRVKSDILSGGEASLFSRRQPKEGNAHIKLRWMPGSPASLVVAVAAASPRRGPWVALRTRPTRRGSGYGREISMLWRKEMRRVPFAGRRVMVGAIWG
jgi:hypothetical protein